MVGNDIVDLRDRDADIETYGPGFDARVFTDLERRALARAADPERERWRMWSAKEASYKLARQVDPTTIFSPRKFEVIIDADDADSDTRATVTHGATFYYVKFDETSDRIHAIAVRREREIDEVLSGVHPSTASGTPSSADGVVSESTNVRRLACDKIARHFELHRDALEIRKENRVPLLFEHNRRLALSVSLSHHGAWLAFACHEGATNVA